MFFVSIILASVGIYFIAQSLVNDSFDDRLLGIILLGSAIFTAIIGWSMLNIMS